MNKLLLGCLFLCLIILPEFMLAQADDCSTPATTVTLSTSTCSPLAGNTLSATASSGAPACVGTADDDVWYRFTTPANAANYAFVYVDPSSSSFDPVFQVLSGACGSQSSMACVDAGAAGVSESVAVTGIASSTTYYFRVYGYASGSGGDGSFTVCAFNGAKPSNDECAGAVNLTQGATCSGTAGTSAWATTSSGIPACVGTADDDVWYRFTTGAGVTYEHIKVVPDADMDAVVQVFSGACGALTSISCQNSVGAGGTEDFFISGLTGSTQYYVRVYHFGSYYGNATNSGTFTICVQGGSPPANDNCTAAVNLPANGSCVTTNGTTTFATPSGTGTACSGYSVDDDVWYSFTAINYTHTITVNPNALMNVQIQILEGTCPGGLLSKQCQDNVGVDGTETMSVTGLTIGNIYYVRISHNGTYYGSDGSFTICNVATVPAVGDDPCGAYQLPTPTAACVYGTYNLTSATYTSSPAGGNCGQPTSGTNSKDIWFKVYVPASSSGIIDIDGFLVSGGINDQSISVYYSNVAGVDNCNALTYIGCNDDFAAGIRQSQISVGSTANYWIYIRLGCHSSATFGTGETKLCVTSPTNEACTSPTFVCDLNGFRGTTNMSFGTTWGLRTAWEVSMEGGSGGPFGNSGTSIENPSWLQFEASATTASLTLTVSDCYYSDGIQFQILAGGTCNGAVGSWTAKSSYPASNNYDPGSWTITATGLTVGNLYYILVDGYAGDLCNYQINGASGFGTTVLVTPASQTVNICSGNTTTLTIDPVGSGGSISWSSTPSGYSGSGTSVIVNPAVSPGVTDGTVTYTATVTGNCITTQTVSATVAVEPTPPTPTVTATPTALCGVTSLTLSASAANANDYEWFNVSSGGAVLHSGNNYTPSVSDNQIATYTWYVSAYNNTGNPACTSSARGSVSVPVNSWDGKIKWEGDVSTAWNNSANWGGCTPTCGVGVIVPDDGPLPFSPTIGGYAAAMDDLQLEQNGILTVNTGSTVSICGTFAHAGSLVIGGGAPPTFTFGGTTKQFYAKTSTGSGDLPNVVINNPGGVEVYDDAGYQDMSLNSSSTLTLTNGVLSTKNTREVYVKNSSTAAISGFGASSYVGGRLRRAVAVSASAYDFPVGNEDAYERMSIQVNGVSGGLTSLLAYFENLSGNDGAGWGSLSDAGTGFITTASPTIPVNIGGANATTGHTYAGVWTVVPNAGSADYNMTLYGRNYSNAGTATHTIVKRNQFTCASPNWGLAGTYAGSSVASNVVTVTRTGMSGFSQFAIGRHSAPLPIELLLFDARCNNDKEVIITWITASEINNDYFTIERSYDNANNFEPIKLIDGAGTSTDSKQYSFIDESFPGGTCYYRLKQTDFDGNYEYFTPVSTSCGRSDKFTLISVVPNPAKDDLFIFYNSYDANDVVTIFITDVLGKLVFSEKLVPQEGLNQKKIDISNYSNGIYYVNVNNGIKSFVEKIVKQD